MVALAACWLPRPCPAQAPGWWTNRAVLALGLPADDYAPANRGQAKWSATNAYNEFNAMLIGQGGAGPVVEARVRSFSPGSDYCPVNLGQIKNLAQPYYDRLSDLRVYDPYLTNALPEGMALPYPWTPSTTDDADYALANVGQLKSLFAFNFDRDNDSLPDWWEILFFGDLNQVAGGDADGDGVSNLQEYLAATDPFDADADGVPDWKDAAPHDPAIGALTITIDVPANGSTMD